jgi:TPR repeat protein
MRAMAKRLLIRGSLAALGGVTLLVGTLRAETSSWSSDPAEARKPAVKPIPSAPAEPPSLFTPGATTHSKSSVPASGEDAAYMAFDQGQYLTALKLAEEAAKKGDATAHTLIGRIYGEGLGVARDEAKAAQWYKRGAELGDANAMFALGVLLAEGRGVKKDRVAAGELFEKAAATGHPEANYNLGMLFLKGDGKPENPYRAALHLRYAAEKGIAQAQYDYGTLYQLGIDGIKPDAFEASRWIGKAADQGLTAAQYDYAVMLLKGLGLNKDRTKAVPLLKAAAEKGVPGAQNRLAHLYLEGAGVDKNMVEAGKWRLIAKASGVVDTDFDAAIAKLPKVDRTAAETAANVWRESSQIRPGP